VAFHHPAAIIEDGAKVARSARVGAFAVIEAGAVIGEECEIAAHAVIRGGSVLGRNNRVHSFCVIGGDAQDKKYRGEESRLIIGDGNTIRECCTLNRGTAGGGGITRVGGGNWIMAYSHIAHDCQIGDGVIFGNGAQLGGHVVVGDGAVLGGMVGIHQFGRVGARAMIGGATSLFSDVPPFALVSGGARGRRIAVNTVGLARAGFSQEEINAVRRAYRVLYRQGLPLAEARDQIASMAKQTPRLAALVNFLNEKGRGIIRPRTGQDED
jgi:UDP-N-acetylglucosamine acyltransferase